MDRRKFIRNLSGAVFLINGQTLLASQNFPMKGKKRILRFAVASDIHFGQPKTPYQEFLDSAVLHLRNMHTEKPFDFGVMNGDLVHDDLKYFNEAKKTLDKLPFRYYVTQGNHDMATSEQWESAWGMPVNFDVVKGDTVLLFATTSNEKGVYLPPDPEWLETKFKQHAKAKHILLFIHIPPVKWTANAIESLTFQDLVKKQRNLRAVFHGHEHDQDGIKWKDNIPYLFDSHLGGNWGTSYRGYRIVELFKDGSMLTYIMDPSEKMNIAEIPARVEV